MKLDDEPSVFALKEALPFSDAFYLARRAYIAGFSAAVEACAEIADKQEEHYHAEMEGQGQPEFGECEFAMCACNHVAKLIRKLNGDGG